MPGELEIVELRVMGPASAVDQLVDDLQAARLAWCDVRGISPPHANRGDDGRVRRYVAVVVTLREGGRVP